MSRPFTHNVPKCTVDPELIGVLNHEYRMFFLSPQTGRAIIGLARVGVNLAPRICYAVVCPTKGM
jgi:hypothetical protein